MTTHWDSDLSRDDLLRLSPQEALAGGLGADRDASAPPLETVCALALAYQAGAEGASDELLGLALVAFGMVRDQVGPGALTPAARDDLAARLTFQAEGYPRTDAWLAALAEAARTGAELDLAQAFLARTIDLWRLVAGGAWPASVTITVDGRRVGSAGELRAAVEAFNATRTSLDGIPRALDPNRLAWPEVELFVAGLARGGGARGLEGAAIELTRPELKLFALDGHGARGLARGFALRPIADGFAIEPAFDRGDVEAELAATEAFLAEQDRAVVAAEAALAEVTEQDADHARRWAAHQDARRAQVVGWILLGVAIRAAQAFLRAEAERGEARPVVAMRAGPADLDRLTARAATLDQAIVSGPSLGRLPAPTAAPTAAPGGGRPGGGPGGAPGAAPGGAPGAAPGGRPGGGPGGGPGGAPGGGT